MKTNRNGNCACGCQNLPLDSHGHRSVPTDKPTHTPTPWKLGRGNRPGMPVVEVPVELGPTIVRAVNNYQQMREALMSYAFCKDACTCGDGWDHRIAQEALAKAEGK